MRMQPAIPFVSLPPQFQRLPVYPSQANTCVGTDRRVPFEAVHYLLAFVQPEIES